ncbi:MAG: DUF3574 domain-containing protein [Ignavibacteriae bacterium]|nr:DUF3574 domain-containing protein [Ignavibacteriota bacterium]MCI0707906.1 DUF3574 domain-containing protein [Ignavibacteriota bacterium]
MRKQASFFLSICVFVIAPAVNFSACSLSRFETGDAAASSDLWIREEIIFGTDIPDGGTVSDNDWQQFLGEIVTPRFPNGFSILSAHGQYLMQDGTIVREKSWILILYLPAHGIETNKAIDEIISSYKQRFKQESVLRSTSPARVQFK